MFTEDWFLITLSLKTPARFEAFGEFGIGENLQAKCCRLEELAANCKLITRQLSVKKQ
jgi:hypothetical protein